MPELKLFGTMVLPEKLPNFTRSTADITVTLDEDGDFAIHARGSFQAEPVIIRIGLADEDKALLVAALTSGVMLSQATEGATREMLRRKRERERAQGLL